MSYTCQEARTYPLGADRLYYLARSAVDATGTHVEGSDINLGRISAKCSVGAIPFLHFGARIWMTLDIQIDPIDASQSEVLVVSRFPELLQFGDMFHQNQKQVNEFFAALDYIIERKLAAWQLTAQSAQPEPAGQRLPRQPGEVDLLRVK